MTFTDAEEIEMAEYQEILGSGRYVRIETARRTHQQDGQTIKAWHGLGRPSEHGQEVCAQILRRMQARKEVFRRVGLSLR